MNNDRKNLIQIRSLSNEGGKGRRLQLEIITITISIQNTDLDLDIALLVTIGILLNLRYHDAKIAIVY